MFYFWLEDGQEGLEPDYENCKPERICILRLGCRSISFNDGEEVEDRLSAGPDSLRGGSYFFSPSNPFFKGISNLLGDVSVLKVSVNRNLFSFFQVA